MESNGEEVDGRGLPGEPLDTALQASAPRGAVPATGVDLAAWGRGERDYIFAEVQKAIDDYVLGEIYKIVDARFVSVKGRRDAVRFLVAEGIIAADEARDDVM